MTSRTSRAARRIFFRRAAALAAGTLAVSNRAQLHAQSPARTIGLGFSLYGMKSLETGAALAALARLGYDCTELPVMSDRPADSARLEPAARRTLRAQLADLDLRLSALMENLPAAAGDDAQHRAQCERLRRAAQLARDLTPDAPPGTSSGAAPRRPVIETILGGKPGDWDAVRGRLADRMGAWAEIGASTEVRIAVKAHVSNAMQRPEQLLWLLDQVASPWLVSAYDYSHFELQDLKLQATLDALAPRAAFVHVKDTERAAGKRGFLLPGEGSIDYVRLLKGLQAAAYSGDVVVEVSSQLSNRPGYDPLAAAQKCYNHLAAAFTTAGVARDG